MELALSAATIAAVRERSKADDYRDRVWDEYKTWADDMQKAAQKRLIATRGLNIPERFASLDSASVSQAIEPQNVAILRALLGRVESCLLYGPVGTGKTSIACVVAQHWGDAAFLSFHDFATRLAALEYSPSNDLLMFACDVPVLVIDDLGMPDRANAGALAPEPPRRIELANQLIGQRHMRNRPTIVTSNLTLDLIAQQFGQRVSSRIAEWKRAQVNGADIRRRNG